MAYAAFSPSSFPRKRESMAAADAGGGMDSRFRGNDGSKKSATVAAFAITPPRGGGFGGFREEMFIAMAPIDRPSADQTIVKAAIYPSIGIARVGNSKTEWYIGPEVPDPLPQSQGFYRDDTGALKREAARFRVYGVNAAGAAVRELTASDAEVVWTVQLANKKAAWYGFQLAMDIPEASAPGSPATTLRNPMIADRAGLSIEPSPRTVCGAHQSEQRFDDGTFMG